MVTNLSIGPWWIWKMRMIATESKVIDQDLLFSDRDDEEIALDFDGQSEEQEYD